MGRLKTERMVDGDVRMETLHLRRRKRLNDESPSCDCTATTCAEIESHLCIPRHLTQPSPVQS